MLESSRRPSCRGHGIFAPQVPQNSSTASLYAQIFNMLMIDDLLEQKH